MKKLYYDLFNSNRRAELVKECIRYINAGLKVFYILPSREAMFDVRRHLQRNQVVSSAGMCLV